MSTKLQAAARLAATEVKAAEGKMNPVKFMQEIIKARQKAGLPKLTSEQADIVVKSHKAGMSIAQTLNALELTE